MPLTIEQFTQRLMSSGVMAEDELREWIEAVPAAKKPRDGEQLARELVKRKRLTAYQALEIYMGKGQSLVLGNYVILDKLGEGGMGLVLKAEHRRMRRVVALKVLSSAALESRGAIQRFEREVQAVAKLEHPNIVTAYDADQAGETNFLVMQYVDGEDLSAIVKKSGPLPVDRAVDCILQAARGLEFAHQNRVIHRDIKPHNLLLAKDGVVKVLDMGLARIEDPLGKNQETTLTSTGAVLGTIDYMSPEQAEDTKTADARSDIYSLGCTLFYLVTGRVPYPGETMMKRLLAHRDAQIPSVMEAWKDQSRDSKIHKQSSLDSSLDSRLSTLDAVFRKMVAKRPEDRHASMTEVIADLQRCLTAPVAKAAPMLVASEDSKLNDFLAMISDPDYSPSAGTQSAGTSVLPSDAQTVQFQGEASDTDPSTLTSIKAAARLRQKAPWWRDRTKLAIAITAAILLLFLAWLAIHSNSPTPIKSDDKKTHETKPVKRKSTSVVDSDGSWQAGDGSSAVKKPADAKSEWRDLLDGNDILQWEVATGKKNSWTITDGIVHHKGKGPSELGTVSQFADFELSLDFRVTEGSKAGVLLRCDLESTQKSPGLEIQLIDDHVAGTDSVKREDWTGAVIGLKEPSARASRPANEWQHLDVECRGRKLDVSVNRTQVIDLNLRDVAKRADKFPGINRTSGSIALQAYTGRVDFRNIRVRTLTTSQ